MGAPLSTFSMKEQASGSGRGGGGGEGGGGILHRTRRGVIAIKSYHAISAMSAMSAMSTLLTLPTFCFAGRPDSSAGQLSFFIFS